MNVIDYLILGILLISALVGFRRGIITSIITFIGTLLVIILAFYLKNPVSEILYQYCPFFDLGGKFEGVQVFNILIYEGLSYILTLFLLSIILSIIGKVTGVFNKLIDSTLILGMPSKILGAICGLFEGYVIAFIVVFILGLISGTATKVNESQYADFLVSKTPVLSEIVDDTYNTITEVYQICVEYKDSEDKTEANLESLDVMLKYGILTVNSADKLVSNGKLTVDGATDVIERYRGESV